MKWFAVAAVLWMLLPGALVVLLAGAGLGAAHDCASSSAATSPSVVPVGQAAPQQGVQSSGGAALPVLDAEQMTNATRIVAVIRVYPGTQAEPHAAVVALATAMQESTMRNLRYGDRDSLGLFQQRPSQGWGTPAQILDVEHATQSFLRHLLAVPGWRQMPVTEAAALVQRPAAEYAGLYARWEPLARSLVARLWTGTPTDTPPGTPTGTTASSGHDGACPPVTATGGTGGTGYPVPAAYIGTDSRNWGGHGSLWSSWHTGTDFSAPCGTPVLAAHGGTIELVPGPSWFGSTLVKIVTGPGGLATWYAHLQTVTVAAGQRVTTGQRLGEVGAQGNATGCHLHFEVHLRNGSIYGTDNVDPSRWLAQHAGRRT